MTSRFDNLRVQELVKIERKRIKNQRQNQSSSASSSAYDMNIDLQIQNKFIQKTIDQIIEVIPRRNPPLPTQIAAANNSATKNQNKVLNMPFNTMKRHVSWLSMPVQSQPTPLSLGQEILEFTKYIMI